MGELHSATKYAVLIPRVQTVDGESLLLEVRSQQVKQPGEVCFPGGKVEPGETIAEAAVREACEELGITPDKIEVLSEFEPLSMTDGRPIYPVTAALHLDVADGPATATLHLVGADDAENTTGDTTGLHALEISKDEVEEVFLLPLAWLADHEPVHYDLSKTPDEDLPDKLLAYLSHYGSYRETGETDYLEYCGYGIWGLTARIIKRL